MPGWEKAGAYLTGAKDLTKAQLLEAFTLYGVKGLDPALEQEPRGQKLELFEVPVIVKYPEIRLRILKKRKREKAEVEKKKLPIHFPAARGGTAAHHVRSI